MLAGASITKSRIVPSGNWGTSSVDVEETVDEVVVVLVEVVSVVVSVEVLFWEELLLLVVDDVWLVDVVLSVVEVVVELVDSVVDSVVLPVEEYEESDVRVVELVSVELPPWEVWRVVTSEVVEDAASPLCVLDSTVVLLADWVLLVEATEVLVVGVMVEDTLSVETEVVDGGISDDVIVELDVDCISPELVSETIVGLELAVVLVVSELLVWAELFNPKYVRPSTVAKRPTTITDSTIRSFLFRFIDPEYGFGTQIIKPRMLSCAIARHAMHCVLIWDSVTPNFLVSRLDSRGTPSVSFFFQG
jgi:hypothetical protein